MSRTAPSDSMKIFRAEDARSVTQPNQSVKLIAPTDLTLMLNHCHADHATSLVPTVTDP